MTDGPRNPEGSGVVCAVEVEDVDRIPKPDQVVAAASNVAQRKIARLRPSRQEAR